MHPVDVSLLVKRELSTVYVGSTQYLNSNFVANTGVPFNEQSIYEVGKFQDKTDPAYSPVQIITGYVGQFNAQGTSGELLADLGMTAVLDGTGEQVKVRTSDGTFKPFDVAWASTNNADDVRDYFNELMGSLFNS